MDLSKYLDLYLSDGRDHLASLRAGLPGGLPSQAADIQTLFRNAHSLKGMAASMGFETTADLAHALEDLLGAWRGGKQTGQGGQAALRVLDLLEALTDRVQAHGSDAGLESEAASAAKALRETSGREPPAEAVSGFQAPDPPATPAPVPSPERGESEALVAVTIDPTSALPAARLLVVCQRLTEALGGCTMEPSLAEVQARGLKSAHFRVPAIPALKEAVRALRELPEVAAVFLTLPDAPSAGAGEGSLATHVKIPAGDLDELLSNTGSLLHHLNLYEAGLSRVERRRHRFWLEEHRSHLNRLFDRVLSVRLVPFELLTERLARVVRDLESRAGKPLRFKVSGQDQQVDRALLERLLDPLTHLLRNAVDHGIEEVSARLAAGKPREGALHLEITREGEALLLAVSDDGRGLDTAAVIRAAAERGLLQAHETGPLSPERLLDLITLPAFSTRGEVSSLSGRGVGLDAARAAVESLGGRLEMKTTLGQGTSFTLVIPSAATLTRVVVFGWHGPQRFALPASQISQICSLASHPLVWAGASRCIQVGERLVPILAWRGAAVGLEGCALILSSPEGERALLVSEVYQSERVVIHPWGHPLDRIPHWIGGTLLSTGELAFVVDGGALAQREGEETHVS